jgi:protein SCO1/2
MSWLSDYRLRGIAILLLAALIGGSALLYRWLTPAGLDLGQSLIGGPFELVDQDGKPVRDTDLRGRFLLLYFGFIFCPDACPTALVAMADAIERLGDAADRVTPVFITVDPERDTPAALKDYIGNFHPRLIGLTGSPEAIARAAKAYRVFYRRADNSGTTEYLMEHSSIVFLIGPDGRYLTHFTHASDPETMAREIRKRF